MNQPSNPWISLLTAVKSARKSRNLPVETDRASTGSEDEKEELLSLLYDAAIRNELRAFKCLIQVPENYRRMIVEATTRDGDTLLLLACRYAGKALVKYLIDVLKADIEQAGDVTRSATKKQASTRPLMEAARRGRVDLVRLLVKRGARVDDPTAERTPLLAACSEGRLDVVKYLLKQGVNPQSTNCHAQTPLMFACYNEQTKVAEYLVKHAKVDVNKTCSKGQSALHYAVEISNKLSLVKLLVKAGAKVGRNDEGMTAVIVAALRNSQKILKYLLKAKRRGEKNCDLVTNSEKAHALELLGCSVINSNPWSSLMDRIIRAQPWTMANVRNGVSLWLRAEHTKVANEQDTSYETSCKLLTQALHKALAHLPPVQMLHEHDAVTKTLLNSTANDYLHANDLSVIYAHALIRRESILGPQCSTSISHAKAFIDDFADSGDWLQLIAYTLSCAFRHDARKRNFFKPSRWFLSTFMDSISLSNIVPVIRIVCDLDSFLHTQGLKVDSADLLSLLQLAADEVERVEATAASASRSQDEFSVSVLLSGVVLLCTVVIRALPRFRLTLANSKTQSSYSGSLQRFETVIRRICRPRLRGYRGCTLLHLAAMNYTSFFNHLVDVCSQFIPTNKTVNDGIYFAARWRFIDQFGFLKTHPNCSLLEVLVRGGADCDARDADGNTPLHLIARQLVQFSANIHSDVNSYSDRSGNFDVDHDDADQLEDGAVFEHHVQAAQDVSSLKSLLSRALAGGLKSSRNHESDAVSAFGFTIFDAHCEDESGPSATPNAMNDNQNQHRNRGDISLHASLDDLLQDVAWLHRMESRWLDRYVRSAVSLRLLLPFAHPDVRNGDDKTYFEILSEASNSLRIDPHILAFQTHQSSVSSLHCLSARRIRALKLPYLNSVPPRLAEFIDLH